MATVSIMANLEPIAYVRPQNRIQTYQGEGLMPLLAVVFEVTRDSVEAVLPPHFTLDPNCDQPTALVEVSVLHLSESRPSVTN